MPTLKDRFGVEGSVISAVDLVNGLGRLAGLEVITVPGATGFLDTDYAAKGRYGLNRCSQRDFLLLHIEAPDEAGHMGRADLKKEAHRAHRRIDPRPDARGTCRQLGDFRLLLHARSCDPVQIKTHSNEAVPFAIICDIALCDQHGREPTRRYTEADAQGAPALAVGDGYRLIEDAVRWRH